MSFSSIRWVALFTSIVLGGCKPDEEETIECLKGEVVRDYCCDDPDVEGERSCEMTCFRKCNEDGDCATDLDETCQDGLCAEVPAACSIER